MQPVYISSAYLGPVQQYCKLYQFEEVRIETAENYLKQTYRNTIVTSHFITDMEERSAINN